MAGAEGGFGAGVEDEDIGLGAQPVELGPGDQPAVAMGLDLRRRGGDSPDSRSGDWPGGAAASGAAAATANSKARQLRSIGTSLGEETSVRERNFRGAERRPATRRRRDKPVEHRALIGHWLMRACRAMSGRVPKELIMKGYQTPSFQERTGRAAEAKQKAIDALKARPKPDEAALAARREAAEARAAAQAEKRAAALAAKAEAAGRAAPPLPSRPRRAACPAEEAQGRPRRPLRGPQGAEIAQGQGRSPARAWREGIARGRARARDPGQAGIVDVHHVVELAYVAIAVGDEVEEGRDVERDRARFQDRPAAGRCGNCCCSRSGSAGPCGRSPRRGARR